MKGISTDMKKVTEAQHRKIKIVIIIMNIIIFIVVFFAIVWGIICLVGQNSLKQDANEYMPSLTGDLVQQTEEALKEGQVSYQNKVYEYNEDLYTFLCLGVDSREDIQLEKIVGEGGQADTILLVVLDKKANTMKMINISRDTMVDVDVYDTNGIYYDTQSLQLALQYAYGDGNDLSCERMLEKVSDLFYGIPIHGYGAMDINAVADLNDAVGGVEITVIEDLSRFTPTLALGNTLTLTGREALHYVQEREVENDVIGANSLRIERQKQYLMAFLWKAKYEMTKDITLPVRLYELASEHMVTNLTVEQVPYLSSLVNKCEFLEENMISVEGEVVRNGEYDEFIIDEGAFFDLMISVFYREVEN